MRRFLVGTLAVIGFLAVLAIAGLVGAGYWYSTRTQETRDIPDKVMLTVDLRSSYSETSDFSPFDYFSDNAPLSISELVLALGKAATDDHVAGLFVRIAETEHGFAKAQEMLEALRHFGAGGKPTVGWADTIGEIGSGNEGYMIASALERLYVQPGGMIGLTGIAIEMPFAREFFDKIGVEPAVFRRGGTTKSGVPKKNNADAYAGARVLKIGERPPHLYGMTLLLPPAPDIAIAHIGNHDIRIRYMATRLIALVYLPQRKMIKRCIEAQQLTDQFIDDIRVDGHGKGPAGIQNTRAVPPFAKGGVMIH